MFVLQSQLLTGMAPIQTLKNLGKVGGGQSVYYILKLILSGSILWPLISGAWALQYCIVESEIV